MDPTEPEAALELTLVDAAEPLELAALVTPEVDPAPDPEPATDPETDPDAAPDPLPTLLDAAPLPEPPVLLDAATLFEAAALLDVRLTPPDDVESVEVLLVEPAHAVANTPNANDAQPQRVICIPASRPRARRGRRAG